ncbi:MAG TPA: L-threonylcarbamoyladenylate synthase [Nitrospirota bacterium]
MAAKIIKVDSARPEAAYSRCREVIASGGVIAYPTDTFYALGADPQNSAAVKRLFAIKGRQKDQPILLLIADPADAERWAAEITSTAAGLMSRYWPGPLTLVFGAKDGVLPELTAGTGTIGLRVPGSVLARGLIRFIGHALTGTSANRSGRPNVRTAQEAVEEIGGLADLILDGGQTAGGAASTVLDVTAAVPRLIREGAVPAKEVIRSS